MHIPEGAIPKDGPSAGVTLATAMVSTLAQHPVRKDVAMTGEITLRGNVLPVGGIKEKVLAARRARVSTIILPQQNQRDMDEVPKELFGEIKFVFVDTVTEVFAGAEGEVVRPRPPCSAPAPAAGGIGATGLAEGGRGALNHWAPVGPRFSPLRQIRRNPNTLPASLVSSGQKRVVRARFAASPLLQLDKLTLGEAVVSFARG